MESVIRAIFGVAVLFGGIILIFTGAFDPQRQGLAIAGSILVAAAYLGEPGSPLSRLPRNKNSAATEEDPEAKNWPRLQ